MVLSYLSRTTIEQQQEVETVRKAETRDVITSVQAHVQSCLDQAAKEGLLLIGKQGGYIFKGQGGIVDPASSTNKNIFLISKPANLKCPGDYDFTHKDSCRIPYVIRAQGTAGVADQPAQGLGTTTKATTSILPDYPFKDFPEVTNKLPPFPGGSTVTQLDFEGSYGRA
ncbi:MAG: hypothetical protein Q7K43_04890, partial [Candidatus Woesearchaeota archaeon]|nr:hypothetical protein [Candidatus Woesearchaeota archaeon]